MWTPRRILLLIAVTALFAAAFVVYNRFLGWIDGLPALPERYVVVARPDQPFTAERNEDRAKRMLRQAFGDNCAEAGYDFQLRLQAQGLILAFHQYHIHDGHVLLEPFSLASIGQINPRTGFPEINTVHCDRATLTFDPPVQTLADLARSKMTAADFLSDPAAPTNDRRKGLVHVVHNHGTPQLSDDMIILAPGPVHFEDSAARTPDKPQLWTDRAIKVIDQQTRPASEVTARTFKLYLEPRLLKGGDKPSGAGGRGPGVRVLELGHVTMNLCLDRSSDFMTAGAKAVPGEKPRFSIETLGAFRYDARTSRGEFTIPPATSGLDHHVKVVRSQPQGDDELLCERLELQFARSKDRLPPRRTPAGGTGSGMQIEEARATGGAVVLTSGAEGFSARATELIFRQQQHEVILRGAPMTAIREGNRIVAPELSLRRPDSSQPVPPGTIASLGRARGPGTVFLYDEKSRRTVEARWADELLLERDNDRERITLGGDAVFDDRAGGQWLRGDRIRIWMAPSADKGASRTDTSHARPETLQVSGHVAARTPELSIEDTPLLVVRFRDVARPTSAPAASAPTIAARSAPPRPRLGAPEGATSPGPPAPQSPIRLSARYIETSLRRTGEQTDLHRVECRERVHVRQEPAVPGERGLDVTAHGLILTHSADGDVLHLSGDAGQPAKVEVNELTLRGPRITFDQRDNRVDVDGAGQLVLLASTDINGAKLEPPTPVTINWAGRMDFVGNRVSFHGGVRADQEAECVRDGKAEKEANRLVCPTMDVTLDRSVSFSQAHRARAAAARGGPDEKPRIRRVVCHRGDDATGLVSITGNLWRDGRRVRFRRIDAPEVTFDNDGGEVTAVCTAGRRGEMRLFQLGNDNPIGLPETPGAQADRDAFRLTRVGFGRQLRANNRSQSISFVGRVQASHAPADDPDARVDPDRLPPGAFTMKCESLEVVVRGEAGRRHTEMLAEGDANIYASDFSGRADVIKYDESKKRQVIFDSKDGNPAVLYRYREKGEPPLRALARTIYYWGETKDFRISDGVDVTGSQ